MKECRRAGLIAAVSLLTAAAIIGLYMINPEESIYSPKCLFYMFTGLECPGCGSQRAIHALLHLRPGEAFRYNAVLVLFIPFLLLLCLSRFFRNALPTLYDKLTGRKVTWAVLGVIIAWWIIRNIPLFKF